MTTALTVDSSSLPNDEKTLTGFVDVCAVAEMISYFVSQHKTEIITIRQVLDVHASILEGNLIGVCASYTDAFGDSGVISDLSEQVALCCAHLVETGWLTLYDSRVLPNDFWDDREKYEDLPMKVEEGLQSIVGLR